MQKLVTPTIQPKKHDKSVTIPVSKEEINKTSKMIKRAIITEANQ